MFRGFASQIVSIAFGLALFFFVVRYPGTVVQLLDLFVNTIYNMVTQLGSQIKVH